MARGKQQRGIVVAIEHRAQARFRRLVADGGRDSPAPSALQQLGDHWYDELVDGRGRMGVARESRGEHGHLSRLPEVALVLSYAGRVPVIRVDVIEVEPPDRVVEVELLLEAEGNVRRRPDQQQIVRYPLRHDAAQANAMP
jgi:hypothetical protein